MHAQQVGGVVPSFFGYILTRKVFGQMWHLVPGSASSSKLLANVGSGVERVRLRAMVGW